MAREDNAGCSFMKKVFLSLTSILDIFIGIINNKELIFITRSLLLSNITFFLFKVISIELKLSLSPQICIIELALTAILNNSFINLCLSGSPLKVLEFLNSIKSFFS